MEIYILIWQLTYGKKAKEDHSILYIALALFKKCLSAIPMLLPAAAK
jgi:hypothetical protein